MSDSSQTGNKIRNEPLNLNLFHKTLLLYEHFVSTFLTIFQILLLSMKSLFMPGLSWLICSQRWESSQLNKTNFSESSKQNDHIKVYVWRTKCKSLAQL